MCYEENDIIDSTVFDHTHDRNIGTVEVNIATGKKILTHTQHQITVTDISALLKRICDNKITTKRKRQSKATVLISSQNKNLIKSLAKHKKLKCCEQSKLFKNNRQTNAILSNEQQNATYACLVCSDTLIQCNLCKEWAHKEYACITDARY